MTLIWQISGQISKFLAKLGSFGNLDLPKKPKNCQLFLGYFRSASLASFWKVRFAI